MAYVKVSKFQNEFTDLYYSRFNFDPTHELIYVDIPMTCIRKRKNKNWKTIHDRELILGYILFILISFLDKLIKIWEISYMKIEGNFDCELGSSGHFRFE
jgi:hypothetical protein